MPTRHYSDYLNRMAGLIGLPYSGMTTDETNWLNVYFNANMETMWSQTNWTCICPFGEARFIGNSLHYTNNIANTTYWTANNSTITANTLANPCDGRQTACTVLETSATGAHGYSQTYNFVPGANYVCSTYQRPIGGRYLYISVNDGVNTYTSFFNLITGTVGTYSSNMGATPTIQQQPNGFWLCSIAFTSATTAGNGTVSYQTSSDGTTLSFAGDTAKGLYSYGNLLQQTTLVSPNAFTLPFSQEGEDKIDTIYQVWRDNPVNAAYPRPQSYVTIQSAIQIIAGSGFNGVYYGNAPSFVYPVSNPFWINYRKDPYDYSGTVYSASATYAVDDQIQYSYTTTNGATIIDYYKCLVATTAGQDPITTPGSWQLLTVFDTFFLYSGDAGFADWLRQDGQHDKAQLQDQIADDTLHRECDTQEREQQNLPPMRVQTHGTTQARF